MARISVRKAKGYTGKMARRSYVAVIDGTDAKYEFSRTFLEADDVDWEDSALYKRSKGTWTEIYDLPPGLYEVVEFGEKKYVIVFEKDGATKWRTVSAARAAKIAQLLDDGAGFEAARLATKEGAK